MANVPWIGTGGLPLLGSGGLPLICDEMEECACEPGEVVIETCEDFQSCFGVVADVAPAISATLSGVTDDGCGDCEFMNNTFISDDEGEYTGGELSCGIVWGNESAGAGACRADVALRVDIIFDPDTTGTFILVQFFGDGDEAFYIVEGEDAMTALNTLCNTGSVEVPFDVTSNWTDCDWPATVLLEL